MFLFLGESASEEDDDDDDLLFENRTNLDDLNDDELDSICMINQSFASKLSLDTITELTEKTLSHEDTMISTGFSPSGQYKIPLHSTPIAQSIANSNPDNSDDLKKISVNSEKQGIKICEVPKTPIQGVTPFSYIFGGFLGREMYFERNGSEENLETRHQFRHVQCMKLHICFFYIKVCILHLLYLGSFFSVYHLSFSGEHSVGFYSGKGSGIDDF